MTLHLSAAFAIALVLAFVRSAAWVSICHPSRTRRFRGW